MAMCGCKTGEADDTEPIIEPRDWTGDWTRKRNLAAFWFLGLTNNFAYVVMLSAATHILADIETDDDNGTTPSNTTAAPPRNRTGHLLPYCNTMGTGAVLIADIIPALLIKLTAPFYLHKIPYNIRVIVIVLLDTASFPIVAFSGAVWVSLIGVICASLASGFGEITYLALSAHFDKDVVSTWSSGTGAAGLFGSLSYLGLIWVGVSPRDCQLVMLVTPVIMGLSYFVLLRLPATARDRLAIAARPPDDDIPICDPDELIHASEEQKEQSEEEQGHTTPTQGHTTPTPVFTNFNIYESGSQMQNAASETDEEVRLKPELSLWERLKLVVPLLPYMVPLMFVYMAEYFINQALFELIYFLGIWLPWNQQYIWYQALYQLGVFISRSSVNLVQIDKLWLLPVLQFVNMVVLLTHVLYQYIPCLWIIFILIIFEGLLGGSAYVNTFYKISTEVASEHREFSMGVASMSDSLGIAISGFVSVPAHNALCAL